MRMLDPAQRRRVPRWLVLLLGLCSVLLGITLITRPFQSLAVLILLVAAGLILTGLSELAERSDVAAPQLNTAGGIAWIGLGIAVVLWPGLSLQLLAIVVGVAVIGGGVTRALSAFRAGSDERLAALLLGAASIMLGVVALFWPDITLLVVAVLFGVQLLLFGLARLNSLVRGPPPDTNTTAPGPSGWLGRSMRTVGAAFALLASLLLAAVSVWMNRGAPVVDAFYDPPAEIPAAPGALLRAEPMSRAIPTGAQAWRILYTTTRADNEPALASALVVAAASPPAGPRPVIAWTHGTTGVNRSCAPSLLKDPFRAGAMPALDEVLAKGWVLVATDYIGLGTAGPHAYLVGPEAGRAGLDAVRAARQLPDLSLAEQIVVWGHSQGGGAALWTGILAPTYAPDANVIGVAALAPASDLLDLVSNLEVMKGGMIFASYIIQGFSDTYPDVRFNDYVRPTARILVREMASRCLAEPAALSSAVESLVIDRSIWSAPPANGPLGARLQENAPSGPILAPLLIGQGLDDDLILPAAQEAYVTARCQAGGQVEYRTYAGADHVGLVAAGSPLVPELLAWTQDRFDGKPASSSC